MKKFFVSAAAVLAMTAMAGLSTAEAAKPKAKPKAADVVITIKNERASALVFFAASEKDVSVSANMLKDAVAPKASVKVNIGKACKVMITADFEDESSVEPVEHDFCKDKVLKLTEVKD